MENEKTKTILKNRKWPEILFNEKGTHLKMKHHV